MEFQLYCNTCGDLICLKCAIKGGRHHSHDYDELEQAFEKYSESVLSSLQPMERHVASLKKMLTRLNGCGEEVRKQLSAVNGGIRATFARVRDDLRVREVELTSQVSQLSRDKMKGLKVQRNQVELALSQLNSCLSFVRESLAAPEDKSKVLRMRAHTMEQINLLSSPLLVEGLSPITKADVIFSASADTAQLFQNFGRVLLSDAVDPSKCHIAGEGIVKAVLHESATAILHAVNFEGGPCLGPVTSLEVELKSVITGGKSVECSAKTVGEGRYAITYRPAVKGRHLLSVVIEGQHVGGSPFNVTVMGPPAAVAGGLGDGPIRTIRGSVVSPHGIAVTDEGQVVVTGEEEYCNVTVFSSSGEKVRSFGTFSSCPCGVAVDGQRNIIVTYKNHCLRKFAPDGRFLTMAGGVEGGGLQQFSVPAGVTYNASNDLLYVADSGNHRIQVLRSSPDQLQFCYAFGEKGHYNGRFLSPQDVVCDTAGKVFVADHGNRRIQIFSAKGDFIRTFGVSSGGGGVGGGGGSLNCPVGIAVSGCGAVYVSQGVSGLVSVFTADGHGLACVRRWGEGGEGCFEFPQGVAVDVSTGVLYVCDLRRNCVHLF